MEIICDYIKRNENYKVFYNINPEDGVIKNLQYIEQLFIGLVNSGNKVLVAVDNCHSNQVSLIFSMVKIVQELPENIRKKIYFILSARQPDFQRAVSRNLYGNINILEDIQNYFTEEFKKEDFSFSLSDIKEFITKYKKLIPNLNVESAESILRETKGYPILVRYKTLNKGLESHVRRLYGEYLLDGNHNLQIKRIKVVIINAIFDLSNILMTDDILKKLSLLETAYDIDSTIIKRSVNENIWKTIHPRWNLEFLSYLFNDSKHEKAITLKIRTIVKEALDSIFDIKDNKVETTENRISSVIDALYGITADEMISIDVMDSLIKIPPNLSKKTKCNLYVWSISRTFADLERYDKSIEKCNTALYIDDKFTPAWRFLGDLYYHIQKYENAIMCYDRSIDIDPNHTKTLYDKAQILHEIGRQDEAVDLCEKANRIESKNISKRKDLSLSLTDTGGYLAKSKKYNESLELLNKAIELFPENFLAFINKSYVLSKLGRFTEALEVVNQALTIQPNNALALTNKSYFLSSLEKHPEALEAVNQALTIQPNNAVALSNKASFLTKLNENQQALSLVEKSIKLNKNSAEAWAAKGLILNNLGKYNDAIRCYDRSLKIEPDDEEVKELKLLAQNKSNHPNNQHNT